MIHRPLALLLLACLAGCDRPDPPAPEPAAPAANEAASRAEPSAAPRPEPAPEPEPVKEQAPAPVVQKVRLKPAGPKSPPPEPVKLDLRLPKELVEAVEPSETLESEPLLPALFGRQIENDFRLNGRLIESPEEDRMFEGAELKIEIRH